MVRSARSATEKPLLNSQAWVLCLLLFAAAASGQQPTAVNLSDDPLYDKEPVIVVDESTTPPTLITSWMSFTQDGSQFYVRAAWLRGSERSPGSAKFLAPKPNGAPGFYANSADPFFAIAPDNTIYLVAVSCDSLLCARDPNGSSEISLWKSSNHGDTWTVDARHLCPQPSTEDASSSDPCSPLPTETAHYTVDKPSIAVSDNNNLYVAHLLYTSTTSAAIIVHRRINGVWDDEPVRVNPGPSTSPGSPIVVLDGAENVYVVWLDQVQNRIYVSYSPSEVPQSIEMGGRQISLCLKGCSGTASDGNCSTTDAMDSTSNLMASYNTHAKSIAIVWHTAEIRAENDFARRNSSDMKFLSFGTETRSFVQASPVTIDWSDSASSPPGNQWTPGIDCDSNGLCLVTYYQSAKCDPSDVNNKRNSVKYRPHATLVDAEGRTIAGWDLTNIDSDPRGYRPGPSFTQDTGMGEYQGVYYSAGKWYSAFIQVSTTGTGDVYVAESDAPDIPCTTTFRATTPLTVPENGGVVHFDVTMAPEGCTDWTPSSNAAWAIINNPVRRFTSGGFDVTIQPNYRGQQNATIRVAGTSIDKSLTITQSAHPCASQHQYKDIEVLAGRCSVTAADHDIIVTSGYEFDVGTALQPRDGSTVDSRCYRFEWTPAAPPPTPPGGRSYHVPGVSMKLVLHVTSLDGAHSDSITLNVKTDPKAYNSCNKRRAARACCLGDSSEPAPSYSKLIQPGESVTLFPPEGITEGSFDWHKADRNNLDVIVSQDEDGIVVVNPTIDTKYWLVYRYTDSSGVFHEETSENLYVLIDRPGAPRVHIEPRFQMIPADAGPVMEVVDDAVTDGNYDGYTFEWNVGNDNTRPSTPLPWPYRRLVLDRAYSDSFWCKVTDRNGNAMVTDVATVAVTCTDGLRGSLGVSPGNYVSRTDRPAVTADARGLKLSYNWFERLPGEATPRLYATFGEGISPTLAQPLTYYSVRIQDACGQTAVLPETPVYLCIPTIDTQPVDRIVPRGGSTSLTVSASPAIAGQPLAIAWRSGETGQAVGSGATLSVTPAPGTTQTFYAEVSADCSGTPRSVQTRTATVTGCALAATAFSDRNIALGQSATLSASISGSLGSDAEYTWYYGPAPGTEYASGVGLWSITPTPQTTTTYWVRAKDGACIADSNPVTVRICVPAITSQPQGTLIRAGQTANLSVGVTPLTNETLQYQWYIGAQGDVTHPVSGATSSTFTTPALSATTSYWVRVTSSCGAATDSAAAAVTVCNNPAISSVTPTRYIRYGGSAAHQVYATGNNLTYQWYIGSPGNTSVPLKGATQSSISQSPSATTTYWARITSHGLCTTDSPAMVIDVCTDPPITTQPASKTINSGQSATLTVGTSATGATYQWFLGTGAAIQGATSSSLTVTPATDNSYFAQVTRGACTSTSDTAAVKVCSLAVSLAGGTNIAYGQSATLSATESGSRSQPTNYEWYAGTGASSYIIASGSGLWQKTVTPSVTTQYWVRISDGTCTADSSPVTVSVCKPTITAQPQGTTVNSSQAATLSVTATGAPLSYQWYIGAAGNTAQPISGATSASYTTPPMSATTSYWVRVTGCTTADSVAATINVCAPPAITSGPTASTQRIPGTTGTMTVAATGTGLAYQWFTGQSGDTTVPVAGSGCNTAQCSFTLSSSKYYWVRMIGTCGTLNSPAVIHPVSPSIYQQPQSASVPPNATPTLAVAASGTGLTYQWYRGTTGNTTTPMSGATAATFTVPPVTAPVSYWCRVTSVGNPTAITDSAEATLSFCTGPSIFGAISQYLGYNQWSVYINVEEQDLGRVNCSWYTGVPGDVSQSVLQSEGGTYFTHLATGTQTWWCRAWYDDHSCYTDSYGATTRKVQ